MDRKGQGIAIDLVIKITLGLIVLLVVILLVYKYVKGGNEQLSSCPNDVCVGSAGQADVVCPDGKSHYPIGDPYCKSRQAVKCCV